MTGQESPVPDTPTPASADRPLLVVENLHVSFPTPRGDVLAVDGVSFRLERGQTLGIVGESGSGKSVLARAIMNILAPSAKVNADSVIEFDGVDLRSARVRSGDYWGKRLSMVFQDPMTSLTPVMRIRSLLTETLRRHLPLTRAAARARAVELLRRVGIPAPERRVRQFPHELSGGMRQRVSIALAIACDPELLLADEPTTALDVTIQRQTLNLLGDLQRESDMAMMLISHDLGVIASRTDSVAVMYAGRIVEMAPTLDLFRQMRHPYTQALLAAIPQLTDPSRTPLEAIPGRPPVVIDPPPGCRFAPRCKFASDLCRTVTPELVELDPGHLVACHHPLGVDTTSPVFAGREQELPT